MYMLDSDSEIVESIVAGKPEGLAACYDKYADPLYTYCRSTLRDPADAADAVQDTFVIAASRLDQLRDREKLRSWLYAVARNECMRILRSSKDTSTLDEAPDVTDTSVDVSEDAERAELRTLFIDASGGLNPNEREVIDLSMQHQMEAGEIAETLGVSRNHAHSLLSRGRDQLQTCLGALLVGRNGRNECHELGSLLSDWDGSLTVLLRKRLHRHIEHCTTCTKRRAFELRPAAFFGVPPMVALAGALAGWWRWVLPADLGTKVIGLATGTSAATAAHRAAILHRAAAFHHGGFPNPVHPVHAGPVHAAGAKSVAFLKTPQGQGTAAAVVACIVAASAAFALTGNNEHISLANRPSHSSGGGGGNGAGGGGGGGGSGSGGSGGSSNHSGSSGKGGSTKSGAGSGSNSGGTSGSGSQPSTGSSGQPGTVPAGTQGSGNSAPASSSPTQPATTRSSSSAPTPAPTADMAPTTSQAGGVIVAPTTITLTNSASATENWAMTVSGGAGTVTVSPAKGSLAPGKSVTVDVAASGISSGQTITLTPGSTQWIVLMGFGSSTPSLPALPSGLTSSLPTQLPTSATPLVTVPVIPSPASQSATPTASATATQLQLPTAVPSAPAPALPVLPATPASAVAPASPASPVNWLGCPSGSTIPGIWWLCP
jgi:RNA polymerase sigma factor (sigma-70 family)